MAVLQFRKKHSVLVPTYVFIQKQVANGRTGAAKIKLKSKGRLSRARALRRCTCECVCPTGYLFESAQRGTTVTPPLQLDTGGPFPKNIT